MTDMDYKAIEKRLQAAQSILQADTPSRATFDSLKTLLSDIHPRLDKLLGEAAKAFKHMEHIQKSDVIALIAEGLPETTPEDKKRKKALLLFLKCWNDLKTETARVEKEFTKSQASGQGNSGVWRNIFGAAKGPLGIVTLIAVGIVTLKMTEVSIVIQNHGCEPMTPATSVAINIPGLMLPSQTIPSSGEAVAKLPPLRAIVDGTSPSSIRLTVLGISYEFALDSSDIKIVFDGKTLNGVQTSLDLGSAREHSLEVRCR